MTAMDLLQEVHSRWMTAMRMGDLETAWQQTDRLEIPRRMQQREEGFQIQPFHLRWNGESWQNRRVLIRCLHGLGDTIQFVRYLPLLRKAAAATYLMAQPELVSFLSCSPAIGPVLDGWSDESGPDHDLEMEIMELPYVFRTRLGTVPDKVPYFDLDAIRKAGQLDLSTNDRGRLKVGLVWDSSRWDTSRSLPKGCMDVWKEIKSVEWFSLQQGSENREVQLPIQAHYFGDDTQEITQAAAVILQMDLVITVDTLVAHLAGALGCPVWLLLSYNPDWRWQSQGSRSAWYPTMRIFRCPQPEAWRATAQMVGRALIDKSKSVHAETI